MTRKERAAALVEAFERIYPEAHCELDFKTPLELLVATILSAQCTDKRVNIVTQSLFQKYRTARDFAEAVAGRHSGWAAESGCEEFWSAVPADASRQPVVWNSGDDSRIESGAGVVVEAGCAAGACQSEHTDAEEFGNAVGGGWIVLGVCNGAARGPG